MAYIELTKGKQALVDDEDFKYLSQWKWNYQSSGYAGRSQYLGGGRKNEKKEAILMHRLIAKTPKGKHTDHKNGNKLDNRKSNLRVCNVSQNQGNTAGYSKLGNLKGTEKSNSKWRARININRKSIHLGVFNTRDQAAEAYREAAIKHYGEFAR